MSVEELVRSSLDRAWENRSSVERGTQLDQEILERVDLVLGTDSTPNRQFLLTIAAGTADDPFSNPAALQLSAGLDRRSQAKKASKPLSKFKNDHGLKIKISQDPGVSNQWREPEINSEWVEKRRPKDQTWASAFLDIVTWLGLDEGENRRDRSLALLDSISSGIVQIALSGQLDYPKFRTTPTIAMKLARQFIDAAPKKPDAMEAIVTAAARSLADTMAEPLTVERRDVNSPDPIDVVVSTERGEGGLDSGIEVTDAFIKLSKIEHEVVPAMLKLGLDRATIVSRGIQEGDRIEVEEYIERVFNYFQQSISLVTIDAIENWLNFPGTPLDLSTDFVREIGRELDEYSTFENRQAWYLVLTRYADSVNARE